MASSNPVLPRPSTAVPARAPSVVPAPGLAPVPALSAAGLATLLLGVFLPMVDFFIVNVALPTMARDLNASSAVLELVVSGYATTYAVLLVLGGRLGDAHGRRRLFGIGMAAFTVTSLLCGLAPTAGALVAARVLQGASAALMVPQTLATIQATGDATSRGRAMAWFGATGGLAAVVGQLLGGVLVGADLAGTGWRMIFLVNVPIGLVGLVVQARTVPATRAPARIRPDLAGTALLALALAGLLVPLTEGRSLGWPWWTWLLMALALVAAGALVVVERRLEARGGVPLLPPSVLAHASMRRGLVLAVPFFAGFGAFMFVYALITQGTLGYGPMKAGLVLTPMATAFLITSLSTTRLINRFGGPRVIGTGALVQLAGLAVLAGSLAASWPGVPFGALLPGLTVMGAGQGLVMSPLFRVVLSDVPREAAGAGSGVMSTTQQSSLALGVATLGTLYVSLAGSLGPLHAVLVVLAVQGTASAVVALGSRGLPGGVRG